MAENVGGTETPPDHSCQPLSNNLLKVIQKEGCHSIKIVQLCLMIQNVLATFNSLALNISHVLCKALCWTEPKIRSGGMPSWRILALPLESVTQDPGSPSASQLWGLPSTFQHPQDTCCGSDSVLRVGESRTERKDAVLDLWEVTVLCLLSCPCFWESYSPEANTKHP